MKRPFAVSLKPETAIVAVCSKCGESGTNPIIGALPLNPPPAVYQIHAQVWNQHSEHLGHVVNIVDLTPRPTVVQELHPTIPKPPLFSYIFRR